MRRTQWAAVAALACTAGCTTATAVAPVTSLSPSGASATFAPGADDLCQPLISGEGEQSTTGPLPGSAIVDAARWCANYGGRDGTGIQLRQSVGSVAALNRALHEPSTSTLPPGVTACAASGLAAIYLEVLDQHGRLYRPSWPSGVCGPTDAVPRALAQTPYRVVALPPG